MGKDYNNNSIKYFLHLNFQTSEEKLWLKRIKKHTHIYISGLDILISLPHYQSFW